eukprot:CAMPEP_0197236322 /NCGR_PEP_ID=MMETSP1429-20130617/3466_1 /TAXON_ID=49237 /ORGANISM="Chaetoceros  sp., Strain UNC1202" /LENGTH=255 /DNA_ID=CAMNT_0042695081 /DNA_START=76 /DNA_END=843 /DNA_ORIENTATION=-
MKVKYAATTVVLSSLVSTSSAFQVTRPIRTQQMDVGRVQRLQPSRLYGSNSFIERLGEAASTAKEKVKSILPFSKKGGLSKKEQKEQPSLTVRMVGAILKPLVSKLAGNLVEAMEEQSRQISDLLTDARILIVQDSQAAQLLGEPIEIGTPFSQASSSMSINGKTQSSTQVSFEVIGRTSTGIATMKAADGRIDSLFLNISGRNIAIDTTKTAGFSASFDDGTAWTSKEQNTGLGRNRGKSDIIDAEFVDKRVDK